MARDVNEAAFAIVDEAEGCVLTAYRDPRGIPTAGYGHTGPDVVLGRSYTMAQALAWRSADMARAARIVETHVRVALGDNQFSALAEFTYNVGAGNFLGSTLLRQLNCGQYAAVPPQLARWNRAGGRVLPGLVARRAREAALFVTPDMPQPPAPAARPAPPSLLERLCAWLHRGSAAPA